MSGAQAGANSTRRSTADAGPHVAEPGLDAAEPGLDAAVGVAPHRTIRATLHPAVGAALRPAVGAALRPAVGAALSCAVGTALRDGAARLRDAGIDNPRLEARLLLAHALGITIEVLLRDQHTPIDRAPYDALLRRRAAREPLALITGRREFWSLDLAVSGATLIPRADSETLIEAALAAFPDRVRVRRVLDLGTGTGCLLLAALSEFPAAFGVGTDCSAAAAALARHNAAMHGMADRAAFVCADWEAALVGRFDLILSNPPYIPSTELHALMPEVGRFESASALDGGPDGLDAYRRILPVLPARLVTGGVAVLELGYGQADAVAALARGAGFTVATRADLAGIERALVLTRGC